MTTESGSDSESKDKEQDQEESPAQEGAAETQPQDQQQQPQQPQQQPSEEHQTALEQFSAVAAHSTPVRKEQVREPKHTCWLHATACLPTYCSWEITSLAR